jgi:hypothetical protein
LLIYPDGSQATGELELKSGKRANLLSHHLRHDYSMLIKAIRYIEPQKPTGLLKTLFFDLPRAMPRAIVIPDPRPFTRSWNFYSTGGAPCATSRF